LKAELTALASARSEIILPVLSSPGDRVVGTLVSEGYSPFLIFNSNCDEVLSESVSEVRQRGRIRDKRYRLYHEV
jgi:hypothetical protein